MMENFLENFVVLTEFEAYPKSLLPCDTVNVYVIFSIPCKSCLRDVNSKYCNNVLNHGCCTKIGSRCVGRHDSQKIQDRILLPGIPGS